MKVFISWSGDLSLKVAQTFREWLPSVIQSIEPYVSSEDIDKGARWSTDIAKELEDSTFGILCVTKDNIEAPWLSFEAGALSKTMEKAFVTPFLFDIKRSEVQGPILQFQSTVFEKEDIKKMIKTLNKACGDMSIQEARLDKAFDVWYPTLEESLNKIKGKKEAINSSEKQEKNSISAKILEEILDLSRDNQKLLRTPDERLHENVENLNKKLDDVLARNDYVYEQKRMRRKYSSLILDEIMHVSGRRSAYGFLMTLSLYREDFPWIYDMGKELMDVIKSQKSKEEKQQAIQEFNEMINFTCNHPIMRDLLGRNKDNMIFMKELPYILIRYLENLRMGI